MLILDIDNFKKINDTYGHPVGDRVINSIAGLLTTHFHTYGIVGRIGGDEFSVFTEHLSKEKIIHISDMLCRDISDLTLIGKHNISCSIGIASCTNENTFNAAYSKADKALYEAKKQGKNRCIIAD